MQLVFLCCWSTSLSFPAGTDLLFFVLPKKSKQKKGAPEMATHPLNFRNRAETGKTRCAQTVSRLVSARLRKFKAPSRAQRQKKKANPSRGWPLSFELAPRRFGCCPLTCPALCGALNFCCKEEKEGRLSERSEFASPPSMRHKFKESFAASGAPFFAYFLWQDKESESPPAGGETRDAPKTPYRIKYAPATPANKHAPSQLLCRKTKKHFIRSRVCSIG